MGGLFILLISVVATITFGYSAIKYGLKKAKNDHDEEELGGVLFIFFVGGLFLGAYILINIIPKSQMEIRILSSFVFLWIWGAIYFKFGDFLSK
jgi:hypothetical protein